MLWDPPGRSRRVATQKPLSFDLDDENRWVKSANKCGSMNPTSVSWTGLQYYRKAERQMEALFFPSPGLVLPGAGGHGEGRSACELLGAAERQSGLQAPRSKNQIPLQVESTRVESSGLCMERRERRPVAELLFVLFACLFVLLFASVIMMSFRLVGFKGNL